MKALDGREKNEIKKGKKTIDITVVLIHPIRPQSTNDLGNCLIAETIMGAKVRHNPSRKLPLSHLERHIHPSLSCNWHSEDDRRQVLFSRDMLTIGVAQSHKRALPIPNIVRIRCPRPLAIARWLIKTSQETAIALEVYKIPPAAPVNVLSRTGNATRCPVSCCTTERLMKITKKTLTATLSILCSFDLTIGHPLARRVTFRRAILCEMESNKSCARERKFSSSDARRMLR